MVASYNIDLALVITMKCISVQRPVYTATLGNPFIARSTISRLRNLLRFFSTIFHFRVTSESFHLGEERGGKTKLERSGSLNEIVARWIGIIGEKSFVIGIDGARSIVGQF